VVPDKALYERILRNTKEKQYPNIDEPCWEWQRYLASKGHGRMTIWTAQKRNKSFYVHRLTAAYALQKEIPEDVVVRHRCHNPKCVNPAHLLLGTIADNNKDRSEAGHWKGPKKNYTKLTTKEVLLIKLRLKMQGNQGCAKLAEQFNKNIQTIFNIRNGTTYKNVKLPDLTVPIYDPFCDISDLAPFELLLDQLACTTQESYLSGTSQ